LEMADKLKGIDVTYDTKSLAGAFNWGLTTSTETKTWSEWMRDFARYINDKADEREKTDG